LTLYRIDWNERFAPLKRMETGEWACATDEPVTDIHRNVLLPSCELTKFNEYQ